MIVSVRFRKGLRTSKPNSALNLKVKTSNPCFGCLNGDRVSSKAVVSVSICHLCATVLVREGTDGEGLLNWHVAKLSPAQQHPSPNHKLIKL